MTPFLCHPTPIDGDTIACREGPHVRIAGINAHELHGNPCPAMPAAQARDTVRSMVLGKTLTCTPVDRSYKRIVATCRFQDGRDLRCAIVASGAAVDWPAGSAGVQCCVKTFLATEHVVRAG